jgi:hypothetical protein
LVEESVIGVGMLRVDVELGRHNREIASQNDRNVLLLQAPRATDEALEPRKLVVEFGTRLRVAVRQVDAAAQSRASPAQASTKQCQGDVGHHANRHCNKYQFRHSLYHSGTISLCKPNDASG